MAGQRPHRALLDRVRSTASACLEGPSLLFSRSFRGFASLTIFLPPSQLP